MITNNYPDAQGSYIGGIFVKEQMKEISQSFESVLVICPLPYGIRLIRGVRQCDYVHGNTEVCFLKYLNIPIFFFLGRRAWLALEKRAVSRELRRRGLTYDCVHAHHTWPSGMVATSIFSNANTPVIITEHTSKKLDRAFRRSDPLFLRAWEMCSRVIRVRKGDIERFHKIGIPEEKVVFIPNGFDANRFKIEEPEESRRRLGLSPTGKILLSVGSLRPVKGHSYLLRAVARLISEGVEVHCVIVGDGKLKHHLENLSSKLRIQEAVRLVGNRPHDEVPCWINACDILVIPSLSEGNPTVMFEALGCGRPVVASRVGGIGEVITVGEQGLLSAPSDSEELAIRIKEALNREWDRQRIRDFAEQFTWKRVASQIVRVYQEALNHRD